MDTPHTGLPGGNRNRQFEQTSWTQVNAARADHSTLCQTALENLCKTYWYPLYAYVRRKGHPPDDARDLTQSFFCHFLERNLIAVADREKGKFRSFLLGSLNNYLGHERQHAMAQKRGGGRLDFSLDAEDAEGRFCHEPSTEESPETAYERGWARTLLEQAMKQLRDEYLRMGKAELYKHLRHCLSEETDNARHRKVAAALGMTPGAVAVAAHRIRQKYRECIRAEITRTIADDEDTDEEYRYLRDLLSK